MERHRHDNSTTGRPAPGSPAPGSPAPGGPAPGSTSAPPGPDGRPAASARREVEALRRLDRVREVLEAARAVIARGWMQDGWYAARPRPRRMRLLLADRSPGVDDVTRACLVAAVAVAAHRAGSRVDVLGEAGPALDAVWHALEESRGRAVPARAEPQEVRVARLRELARWNDTPGRTREDVLAVLDGAISRTIMSAVGGRTTG